MNTKSPPRNSTSGWNHGAHGGTYRPLNVRDALSYLDQVKVQFSAQPDVYNRFLDVMKEFKGQIIDTPGVIDRVSTLFRGHPSLIQGFNTFLPPGYRIDCYGGEGEQSGMITVTTPMGTISQVAGRVTAALEAKEKDFREAAAKEEAAAAARKSPGSHAGTPTIHRDQPASSFPSHAHVPAATPAATTPVPGSTRTPTTATQPAPSTAPAPAHTTAPLPTSGPSTPSTGPFAPFAPSAAQMALAGSRVPMMEFNHAISFVNKIKNRFHTEPDTYKQFLEILQTYQRDTRDITEVYQQVTVLFEKAPDLLDEFKQFLPENGSGGFGGLGLNGFMAAAGAPSVLGEKVTTSQKRSSKDTKDAAPQKKRRGAQEVAPRPNATARKPKPAHKADSPSVEDDPINLSNAPQTLASPDEVAFFDKVKKFIDDKVTYHEFLKLINLFVQDMIDVKILLERAALFIGDSGEVWTTFKKVVGADDAGNVPPDPVSAQGGYGFGGMIGVDSLVVQNTPMLDRVKPDLSGSKVKNFGPSYRKLPKSEINLTCTGRDAMCWEVLNDEWVSHPTWAAEDAAPFMAHRKNIFEEALHKSEEERHEYDYHIEANLRTIALLEPLNNKIQTMDPEERSHFNLKAGLGGQSKSIYQRIIKKVYGKEVGLDIIRALHDNPAAALPIVLERLKSKDEEWKKAQREWNRVWREQDAKNFFKALDHQGVQFKTNDKKTIAAKSLIAEVEAKRREQSNARAMMLRPAPRTRFQFEFDFKDTEVLKDVIKIVISYLDRVNGSLSPSDKDRIERQLRDFVPLFFNFDQVEFDAEFGDAEHTPDEEDSDSDGDVSMADDDETASTTQAKRGKKIESDSLRKRLLKQAGEREKRDTTQTPGPEEDASAEGTPMTDGGDRGETPLPVPADPEMVAQALEKDKAGADASEQTWVQIDTPEGSRPVSEGGEEEVKIKPIRKANFFANNHFYVLIRLLQILYDRLMMCKKIAADMTAERKQPINPTAIKLGLAEPETQYFGIENGENPAAHYYTHLLSMAERLFENEVDMATYEETLRLMFGTKAYIMFTLDKLVAAIVKQTQTVLGDLKSQELLALLQRDRTTETTTTRQQIAYRMQAEGVLGPEENLFKIEYHAAKGVVTVQLMGKEDLTVDDAETVQQQWKQYIESYALTHPTEGLPHKIEQPFLNRNLEDIPSNAGSDAFLVSSAVEIKIAMGSYRMFYTPETEDFFHRIRSVAIDEEEAAKEAKFLKGSTTRLEAWLKKKSEPPAASPET